MKSLWFVSKSPRILRSSAVESLLGSNYAQKTFDRTLNELSNGVQLNEILLEINRQKLI